MLDWDDLRYVFVIARSGTLSGAARELKVEHTTVGRRLTAIEAALGTRLFTRGSTGLSPTPACKAMLPKLQEIADRIEAVEARASGSDARLEGSVTLTVPELLTLYLLERLKTFHAQNASITVDVLSGDRWLDLASGEADLGIRAGEVDEPDLVVRRLATIGVSLYASAGYLERHGAPPSVDDLSGHHLIGLDANLAQYPGAAWLEARSAGAVVVMRGHTISAVYNAALEGLGLAVLPCIAGSVDARLRRVTARVVGTRNLQLVVHPDRARLARVRALMEFLLDQFERDRALFGGDG
jgi:DNA-binding transcriptional LysR family regulator